KFGVIAIESSSVNVIGRSCTCLRTMASGIFGPLEARAKMYTVSVGDTLPASAGASLTVPASELAEEPDIGVLPAALLATPAAGEVTEPEVMAEGEGVLDGAVAAPAVVAAAPASALPAGVAPRADELVGAA